MIDRNGKKIYNCPNCAAPIGYSPKCEYCGTVLRWIPTCEIKTVYVNVNKIVAHVAVPSPILEAKGAEDFVLARLKSQLAERLPEIWTVKAEKDLHRDETVYRAEILIGTKEERAPGVDLSR